MSKEDLEFLVEYSQAYIDYYEKMDIPEVSFDASLIEEVLKHNSLETLFGSPLMDRLEEVVDDFRPIIKGFIDQIHNPEDDRRSSDVMVEEFGYGLLGFMGHDIAHMAMGLRIFTDNLQVPTVSLFHDPDYYRELAPRLPELVGTIRRQYANPHRLVRALCLDKLDLPLPVESVSLGELANESADIVGMRYSAPVVDHQEFTPRRISLFVDGDVTIETDRGMMWSVIYNNIKNAVKKLSDTYISDVERITGKNFFDARPVPFDKLPQYNSSVSIYDINDSFVGITFSDSGSALDINKMVDNVRQGMKKYDNIPFFTPEMKKHFTDWKNNDYAFNFITMEDVANVAFMARMSGDANRANSGMGLYGTRLTIEQFGGAIIYATKFSTGNPMFTYILPRTPQPSTEKALSVRKDLLEGKLVA